MNPDELYWQGEYNRALRQRDELRAALAPLLDNPIETTGGIEEQEHTCRVGSAEFRHVDVNPDSFEGEHELDCPVLHKDELLGRPSAAENLAMLKLRASLTGPKWP